jgi:GNAT superfamily N-acetyltransferase
MELDLQIHTAWVGFRYSARPDQGWAYGFNHCRNAAFNTAVLTREADEDNMTIVEYERDSYIISTNKSKLDVNLIYDYLTNQSYWAKGRSLDVVRKTIENSLCFGVYRGGQQVGFARLVTDYATFAWLCDVFLLPGERGKGLGKWLVSSIIEHPDLHNFRRIMLATSDAHELYQRYAGFTPLKQPDWIMERVEMPSELE